MARCGLNAASSTAPNPTSTAMRLHVEAGHFPVGDLDLVPAPDRGAEEEHEQGCR